MGDRVVPADVVATAVVAFVVAALDEVDSVVVVVPLAPLVVVVPLVPPLVVVPLAPFDVVVTPEADVVLVVVELVEVDVVVVEVVLAGETVAPLHPVTCTGTMTVVLAATVPGSVQWNTSHGWFVGRFRETFSALINP